MKPVACWHHGDVKRLEFYLGNDCIDLYGPEEVSEKAKFNSLDYFWNRRMRLKEGDRIQILVGDEVLYTATIDGPPKDFVGGIPPWQSVVPLRDIDNTGLPKAAKCRLLPKHSMQCSHRFDGKKTRYMMTLDR